MSDRNDWDLVAQAQTGDRNAFAELVRRHQAPVMQFCLRMTGSAQDAEDLAQESFVRVYRYLARLTPRAQFTTVLFGIARNLTLNFLRDAKRHGRDVTQSLDTAPQVSCELNRPDRSARLREIEEMILRGMERLSPEHREIIMLREFNDMDYDAIATVIRCRAGTVKSRLARAREQLRAHIVALGGEPI